MKKQLVGRLYKWYLKFHRELPWRQNRNPYRIWISEIMLQQTTVNTVRPYYERFIKAFPDIQSLAEAKESDVLSHWAGLGYYSRAKNLYKSSKLIAKQDQFPQTAQELIQYPGIGEYTSRAISSIAFNEPVGVIDGNVIRILTRLLNDSNQWWKTKYRSKLQVFSDELNQQGFSPSIVNQALMELGALICLPKKPQCDKCPWSLQCKAYQTNKMNEFPIKRPKQEKQTWLWETNIIKENNKYLLVKSTTAPFLKNYWLLPYLPQKLNSVPRSFNFKHNVTKYNIFVQRNQTIDKSFFNESNFETVWVEYDEIESLSHSSITSKILKAFET